MAISNLQGLGIYTNAIDNAVNIAEAALRENGLDDEAIKDLHGQAFYRIEEVYPDFDEITNVIIQSYFEAALTELKESNPDLRASYYVNGDDSHIYINGEEVFA